jgi:hypothetical protein
MLPVPGKREDDERSKDIVEDRESNIKNAGGAKLKGGGGIGQSLFLWDRSDADVEEDATVAGKAHQEADHTEGIADA